MPTRVGSVARWLGHKAGFEKLASPLRESLAVRVRWKKTRISVSPPTTIRRAKILVHLWTQPSLIHGGSWSAQTAIERPSCKRYRTTKWQSTSMGYTGYRAGVSIEIPDSQPAMADELSSVPESRPTIADPPPSVPDHRGALEAEHHRNGYPTPAPIVSRRTASQNINKLTSPGTGRNNKLSRRAQVSCNARVDASDAGGDTAGPSRNGRGVLQVVSGNRTIGKKRALSNHHAEPRNVERTRRRTRLTSKD